MKHPGICNRGVSRTFAHDRGVSSLTLSTGGGNRGKLAAGAPRRPPGMPHAEYSSALVYFRPESLNSEGVIPRVFLNTLAK